MFILLSGNPNFDSQEFFFFWLLPPFPPTVNRFSDQVHSGTFEPLVLACKPACISNISKQIHHNRGCYTMHRRSKQYGQDSGSHWLPASVCSVIVDICLSCPFPLRPLQTTDTPNDVVAVGCMGKTSYHCVLAGNQIFRL